MDDIDRNVERQLREHAKCDTSSVQFTPPQSILDADKLIRREEGRLINEGESITDEARRIDENKVRFREAWRVVVI